MSRLHTLKSQKLVHEEAHSFGLLDQKGRAVGYRLLVSENVWEENTNPSWGWPKRSRYWVTAGPTRDGVAFGAAPRTILADTLDEAIEEGRSQRERARVRYGRIMRGGSA